MDQVQLNHLPPADSEALSEFVEPASEGPYPLSYAQESLWFVEQVSPGTAAYNIPEAWLLKGRVLAEVLQKSIDEVVRRHEVLRTFFQVRDGKPEQVVLDRARLKLEVIDLPKGRESNESLRLQLDQFSRQPFDLTRAPLARASLFRLAADEQVLCLNQHHLISDAWSQGLFMAELAACYAFFVNGEPCNLPPLPVQYADFALWQREMVESESGRRHLGYWKEQFPNLPKQIALTCDQHRSRKGCQPGQTQFFDLPKEVVEPLKELSRQQGVTLYMTLLAAFKTLLHRYTRETDIVVGSPIACRDRVEVERLLGFFVHTHALRSDLSGDPTFFELLQRVREVVLQAYVHQEVPGELLLKSLPMQRSAGGHPLFQVVFGWQNTPPEHWNLPGADASKIELETGTAKFNWTVLVSDSQGGLRLRSEFSTDLFEPATMARVLRHFQALLEQIAASPTSRISEFSFLTQAEREQVLLEWNGTQSVYERESRIHELFEEQAAKTPDATALVFEASSITYGELNRRANQFARRLCACGVTVGWNVGVCMARSPEMIIGILGILKAGGSYVPLDSEYPAERLVYMLRDADVKVLVSGGACVAKLQACGELAQIVLIDNDKDLTRENVENLRVPGEATDQAYVMYTSGSTGAPKGTLVPHRAVVRLVRNTNYLDFTPDLVFLQSAPISFDASTFEMWGALLNGARLVLLPPSVPSLEQLGRAIRDNGVTTLWLTAGLFDQMIEYQLNNLSGLRHLLAGGDVLSPASVARAVRELPGCQLINGYGPTENTTFTCCFRIPGEWREAQPVPIGKPIANTRVYLVDERLKPVPVGVPGELYTTGDGLALGYLNQPQLTAEKFVPNPFKAGELMYRTGDLARWLPGGNLEFLGRLDAQVKIRGYRVEPGEVERALAQHPSLATAAVIARQDAFLGKQLVAYAVARAGKVVTPCHLREYLESKLPLHLIPARFVLLESLPLTANGKIDRCALPEPQSLEAPTDFEVVEPRTATEELVAKIWRELLGRSKIGIHDDFFRLGGHSLIATQMISRLSHACGMELPVRAIFEAPTVAGLAGVVESSQTTEPPGVSSVITRSGPARAEELLEHLEEFTEAEMDELLRDPQLKHML